jgi:hypothetical protein
MLERATCCSVTLTEIHVLILTRLCIGVWAGGAARGGGHVLPQNFYGRAKINAKFGQNIKNSGKFWYVQKKYLYLCENDAMLGKFFWYVRKFFFDMSGKNFLVTRPRSPTILGENINVQFACSGKLYCAPKTRLGPYDHVVMNSTKIRQCNFMSKNVQFFLTLGTLKLPQPQPSWQHTNMQS